MKKKARNTADNLTLSEYLFELNYLSNRPKYKAEDFLVFMPTYAPDKNIVKDGFRNCYETQPLHKIISRGLNGEFSAPWTYLDAIDSVSHILGNDAHISVADFRSSEVVQNILREHLKYANLPNYELLLGKNKESQWKAMNQVLKSRFKNGSYKYFIYTSSDILWGQADWIKNVLEVFEKDEKCLIAYPTVNKGLKDQVPYQISKIPLPNEEFEVNLANAYGIVFKREFFEEFDFKYPDIFRNCYTEGFLHRMLKSIGANQKMVPNANLLHADGMDIWCKTVKGVRHYYSQDQDEPVMKEIIDRYLKNMGNENFRNNSASQKAFFKSELYRNESYYQNLEYETVKYGCDKTEEEALALAQQIVEQNSYNCFYNNDKISGKIIISDLIKCAPFKEIFYKNFKKKEKKTRIIRKIKNYLFGKK